MMHPKKLYTYLYEFLNDVTPIGVDCGKLCNAACCKGDDDTGMYLFPYEEVMYDGNEDWLKIYDSDFIFKGKPVKIAVCNGSCDRNKRPLSCRIFPLFQTDGKLAADKRASAMCPLVAGKIALEDYDKQFTENVEKVFNILNKYSITKKYVKETEKIIKEYENPFYFG